MAVPFSAGLWQKFRNAVCKDNIGVMETLFEDSTQPQRYITNRHRDADWNMGDTALGLAAERGSPKATQWLLNHGADIETVNNHGATPLSWACCVGNMEVVKLLVQAGAGVNRETAGRDQGIIGYITQPIINALPEAIVYLIQHGAMPLASGCVARTALDPVQMLARCSTHPTNALAPAPVTPTACVQKLRVQFIGGRPLPVALPVGPVAPAVPGVRPVLVGHPESVLAAMPVQLDTRGPMEQSIAIAVAMRCRAVTRFLLLLGVPLHPAVHSYVMAGQSMPGGLVAEYSEEEHPKGVHSEIAAVNPLVEAGAELPWHCLDSWHGLAPLQARAAELAQRNAAAGDQHANDPQHGDIVQLWQLSGEEMCAALIDGLTHIHGVQGSKRVAKDAAAAHKQAKADGAEHAIVYGAMFKARNAKQAVERATQRSAAVRALTGQDVDDVGLLCVQAVLAVLLRKYGERVRAMVQQRGKGEFLARVLEDSRLGWMDRRGAVLARAALRAGGSLAALQQAAVVDAVQPGSSAAGEAAAQAAAAPGRGVKRRRESSAPAQGRTRSTRSRRK